jgi:hypothetical protein
MANPGINVTGRMESASNSADMRAIIARLEGEIADLTRTMGSVVESNKKQITSKDIDGIFNEFKKDQTKTIDQLAADLVVNYKKNTDEIKAQIKADKEISKAKYESLSSLVKSNISSVSSFLSKERGESNLASANKSIGNIVNEKMAKLSASLVSPSKVSGEFVPSQVLQSDNNKELAKVIEVAKKQKNISEENKKLIDQLEKTIKSDKSTYDSSDPDRIKKLTNNIVKNYANTKSRERDEAEAQVKATLQIIKEKFAGPLTGLKSMGSSALSYLSQERPESSLNTATDTLRKAFGSSLSFASKLVTPRITKDDKREVFNPEFGKANESEKIDNILGNTEDLKERVTNLEQDDKSDDDKMRKKDAKDEEIAAKTTKGIRDIRTEEEQSADQVEEIKENVSYMLGIEYKKSIAREVMEQLEESGLLGKKGGLLDWLKGLAGGLLGGLKNFLLEKVLKGILGKLGRVASKIAGWIGKGISKVAGWITKGIGKVSGWISKGLGKLSGTVSKAFKSVTSFVGKSITSLSSKLGSMFSSIKSFVGSKLSAVWKGISSIGGRLAQFGSSVLSGLKSIGGSILKGAGNIIKGAGSMASKGLGMAGKVVSKGLGALGVAGAAYGAYSMATDKEARDKEASRLGQMSLGERVLDTAFDPIQQGKNIAVVGGLAYDIVSTRRATSNMIEAEMERAKNHGDRFDEVYAKMKEKHPENTASTLAAQQAIRNMAVGPIQSIAVSQDTPTDEKVLANEMQRMMNTDVSFTSVDALSGKNFSKCGI